MSEYLKTISNINATSTGVSLSSSIEDGYSVLELSGQPPEMTSSSIVDKEDQPLQDNAKYLSPQKVKLRKYTLKKG